MPEYILPRDGTVGDPPVTFDSLDGFTQGYIEALFFTESSPAWSRDEIDADPDAWADALSEGQSDGTLPSDAGFSDLTADALASIMADCEAFQRENAELLAQASGHTFAARTIGDGSLPGSHREAWDYDDAAAGRDYWYTRNGHGVGFWDRGLGEVGDKLADAARYSEVDVYWTDAGEVSL